ERRLHSLVRLALLVADEAVGVLAVYATETAFFDAAEMKLLLELAGDIGFALDHINKAERLDYLALYDPLTGLPNRKLFDERLSQHLVAAVRDNTQLLLCLWTSSVSTQSTTRWDDRAATIC